MKPKVPYTYYNIQENKKIKGNKLIFGIHFSYCHRKPERSFFYKGKQFPVCARCTGIYVGYITFPFFLFNILYIDFLWTVILIIPAYFDGFIQEFFNIESTNTRRFITGLLSGIGKMSLVSIIGKFIGTQILLLI